MLLKLKPSLFLLTLFSLSSLFAQKTARFNGKPYLIYPQTVDVGYSSMQFTVNKESLEMYNYRMPPVIGTIEDGEYLMYSTAFDLKNKRKIGGEYVYDTIYKVFATLTIKDNKKEGLAHFYSDDDQLKPFASLPYHNDMLNGSVNYYQAASSYYPKRGRYDYSYSYSRSSDYDNDYEYVPGGDVRYKSYLFHLHFKDGVLDGQQTVKYLYGKKDTVVGKQINMSMGQKSGTYTKNTYYLEKKKLKLYRVVSGVYVKGDRQGDWKTTFGSAQFFNKNYYLEHYINGKMTVRSYYSDGMVNYKYLFGKDSVLKYARSYQRDSRMPIVKDYTFNNDAGGDKDFIYFYYSDTVKDNYTYVVGDSARNNYYKVLSYWKDIKDTIIDGRYVLISRYKRWKGGMVETAYLVDSCSKWEQYNGNYSGYRGYRQYSESTFCKSELWEKEFTKKGTFVTYTFTYEKLFTADSLTPKSKGKYKKGAYTEEDFYHMALDYSYSNIKFVKGRYQNYQQYFVVSGGYKDGRVLKVIKLPTHYDTLTITDTLMLKGKFLYQHDEVFYKAFGDYYDDIFDADHSIGRKEQFNKNFLSFFEVAPNVHRSIYLGRKPFTGAMRIRINYVNRPNKIKANVYEITQFFDFLTKKQIIELKVEMNKDIKRKYYRPFIMPVKTMNFGVEEGCLSGNISFWDIFGGESISSFYASNKLVSELNFELYRINSHERNDGDYEDYYDYEEPMYFRSHYRPRKPKKIRLDNTYEVTSSSIQYGDGKKFGQWHIVSDGQLEQQYNYRMDKKEGMQYVFTGYHFNTLNYVYNAKRDTVDGKVWNLESNGSPAYSGNFKMGVPHGYFTRYNEIDTLNRFSERYQFENGYMVGRYESYRDSGELKMTIDLSSKDSMYYDIYHVIPRLTYNYHRGKREGSLATSANQVIETPDLSGDDFLTGIFSTSYIKKGFYKNYYKSGGVFSEGLKESNTPVGHWNFYREGKDRIYKRIEFHDSIIEVNGDDTVRSYGLVRAYYDDGRLMFKGLALDQETKYSCESEADIPTEEDYYLEFYDTIGKPVLVNGSGFIEELQANGYKLKEGRMVNGKKAGIWVYYSKFGLPSAIGAFENGKKNGRWLVGDLGGLNLNDKVCFMSNEEFIAWINTYGGNLNLTEQYYTEGKLTSGNSVDTIKR